MNLRLVAVLLIGIAHCNSQSFTLKWDASPSLGITNYMVYGATNAGFTTNLAAAPLKMSVGTNLGVEVNAVKSGRYYFTATAIAGGVQSSNSNVVAVDVPEPPALLYTVAVMWGGDVGSVTNPALFLKLKPIP